MNRGAGHHPVRRTSSHIRTDCWGKEPGSPRRRAVWTPAPNGFTQQVWLVMQSPVERPKCCLQRSSNQEVPWTTKASSEGLCFPSGWWEKHKYIQVMVAPSSGVLRIGKWLWIFKGEGTYWKIQSWQGGPKFSHMSSQGIGKVSAGSHFGFFLSPPAGEAVAVETSSLDLWL